MHTYLDNPALILSHPALLIFQRTLPATNTGLHQERALSGSGENSQVEIGDNMMLYFEVSDQREINEVILTSGLVKVIL